MRKPDVQKMRRPAKNCGFTLLEAMIALAIVAILATLAYPTYMDAIRKGRRADAGDAMLYIQQLQEKWRASNIEYGTLLAIGYPGTTAANVGPSSDGNYTLTGSNATATTYTVSAAGQGSQAADTGNPVDCTTLTLTVTAANPRGIKTPTDCWAN